MNYIKQIYLYTDGGAKGNPGPSGIGVIICDDNNKVLYRYLESIGHVTNNQAEYQAMIKGIDLAAKFTRKNLCCTSDSELLIKQINGEYRLKNDILRELWHEIQDKLRVFENFVFQHVKRNADQRIQEADRLVKNAQNGQTVD